MAGYMVYNTCERSACYSRCPFARETWAENSERGTANALGTHMQVHTTTCLDVPVLLGLRYQLLATSCGTLCSSPARSRVPWGIGVVRFADPQPETTKWHITKNRCLDGFA